MEPIEIPQIFSSVSDMMEKLLARKASLGGYYNDSIYYNWDLNSDDKSLIIQDSTRYPFKKYKYDLDVLKKIMEKEEHNKKFFAQLEELLNDK